MNHMVRHSDYYAWLLDEIDAGQGAMYSDYQSLIEDLYLLEYRWVFELDENRAAGGINLRSLFAFHFGVDEAELDQGPCSVLEMFVALAKHMHETYGDTASRWFWEMMSNMELDHFCDGVYDTRAVKRIINDWMDKKFSYKGQGSPFPLESYNGDVRNMELWDAMNAYMVERYPLDENWLE